MLKVEVSHDGYGKYDPHVTVSFWELFRLWPIRHEIAGGLLRGGIWTPPLSIRYGLLRYKHVQLPDHWPDDLGEAYFLLQTLVCLGIVGEDCCAQTSRCHRCRFHPMTHRPDGSCMPLRERMKRADWDWHFSDDPKVRADGELQTARIRYELEQLKKTDPQTAERLWKEHGPKG